MIHTLTLSFVVYYLLFVIYLTLDIKRRNKTNNEQYKSLMNVNNFILKFYDYNSAIEYLNSKLPNNQSNLNNINDNKTDEKDSVDIKCNCGLIHSKINDLTNYESKYCLALSIDIDHLGSIKQSANENEGRKNAFKIIVKIGELINKYCKKMNWVGYHTHGDEYAILIGNSKISDLDEQAQLIINNSKEALNMIDIIKQNSGLSVTVGIADNMFFADQALSTAKKNNYRSIVAIWCFNVKKHWSWIARNENEIEQIVNKIFLSFDSTFENNAKESNIPYFLIKEAKH